jgi:hypothetical protein
LVFEIPDAIWVIISLRSCPAEHYGEQGLYTAGMSQKFIDHATSYTDGVFNHGNTMEEAKRIADELKRQLVLKGRRPEDFIVSVISEMIKE